MQFVFAFRVRKSLRTNLDLGTLEIQKTLHVMGMVVGILPISNQVTTFVDSFAGQEMQLLMHGPLCGFHSRKR